MMELDVKLHWDHIPTALLDEHRRSIVDDVALPCVVEPPNESWMLLQDWLWH
jgi:hypothetical protein